ncbi:MAG: hypothetical protein K0Q50_22 [Vampirovibrio sp.]|jgi:hypothetical protein|nr:hypothetical protein [Vampirovibrio sp.]
MNKQKKILLSALAGVLLLAFLFGANPFQSPGESAARQKLDHLLGQADESLPNLDSEQQAEQQSQPPEQEPSAGLPGLQGGSFFGMPMPLSGAGVDVQELSDKYVLRVPLADPQDASSVKLNVSPHRIEISGQTGSKRDGASITSSFMQSFSTSQEVVPDRISKRTEQNGDEAELVITIPKKRNAPADEEIPGLNGPDSAGNQNELPSDENTIPRDPNANPLDGVENKVI